MARLEPLDQFEFHHVLAAATGPSLVVFTGPACGACRLLKAHLSETALFDDIRLFEVDAEREMALTREFEVFHLPALFLFVNGEFHRPLHAEPLPGPLRAALDAALREAPLDPP